MKRVRASPSPDLAARAAMSPRHFARVFTEELGMTPARYVLAQRVEAARRELERTARAGGSFGAAHNAS